VHLDSCYQHPMWRRCPLYVVALFQKTRRASDILPYLAFWQRLECLVAVPEWKKATIFILPLFSFVLNDFVCVRESQGEWGAFFSSGALLRDNR
jgi:hypothetical protein